MEVSPICVTCGTQFSENSDLPVFCPVCADDRQYIPASGQAWTDPKALADHHAVQIKRVHEGLFEFSILPSFAIGQRAFLVLSPHGNVLWDCIPLLDGAAASFIKAKGGLAAVAVSHPHYYSNMNHWAEVFDCRFIFTRPMSHGSLTADPIS